MRNGLRDSKKNWQKKYCDSAKEDRDYLPKVSKSLGIEGKTDSGFSGSMIPRVENIENIGYNEIRENNRVAGWLASILC